MCIASREVLFQSQELPPVSDCILSQKPKLGKRIDNQSLRLRLLDLSQEPLDGTGQLHLSRMEYGVMLFLADAGFVRNTFGDGDALQGSAM